MAERTTERPHGAGQANGERAEPPEDEGPRADAEEKICPVGFCPIGAAVNTAGAVRPDAVGHLLAAGRELLLAARAVIDDRADEVDRAVRDLEKIDIR